MGLSQSKSFAWPKELLQVKRQTDKLIKTCTSNNMIIACISLRTLKSDKYRGKN